MTKKDLVENINQKNSYLCVGLDTDIHKIPKHLLKCEDPIFEFNKKIIDATADFCVAYKPNIAFYEAAGPKGWESLAKTLKYIPENCFTIADAKRGDIGNTSSLYARTFFDEIAAGLNFDAVTVAPYMGEDSVLPFLDFKNKWVILLALTSNIGSKDFQIEKLHSDQYLYELVLKKSQEWANDEQMMYVVGATQAESILEIRKCVPNHFLLIPGVGAQGGSLEEVSKNGMNDDIGLLVNSSRAIIYASANEDFADKARQEAQQVQKEMQKYLELYC